MNKILRSFLLLIVVLVLLLLLWPALRNQLLKLSDTLAEQTAARVVALLPIEKFEYRAQRIVNALDKSVQDNRLEIRRMEPDFLVAFPLMFDNAGLVELHEAGACDAPLAKRKSAGLPTPAGSGETPCYAP